VCEVYGEKNTSKQATEKWCDIFKNSHTDITDETGREFFQLNISELFWQL